LAEGEDEGGDWPGRDPLGTQEHSIVLIVVGELKLGPEGVQPRILTSHSHVQQLRRLDAGQ